LVSEGNPLLANLAAFIWCISILKGGAQESPSESESSQETPGEFNEAAEEIEKQVFSRSADLE